MSRKIRLPAQRPQLVEVLERTLTKGLVLETEKPGEACETTGKATVWLNVSVADVDILTVEGGFSCHPLIEWGE